MKNRLIVGNQGYSSVQGQAKGLSPSSFRQNYNNFQPRSPKIERIFHPQAQHSRLRRRFLGGGDQLRPPQIRRPGAHFTIILWP
jgi:hypothetical protein